MAQFLPAGTELCIRGKSGQARWYTTTREIDLPDTLETVHCPLTRRVVRTVRNHTQLGEFQIFFLPEQVAEREKPVEGQYDPETIAGLQACLLYYDIPENSNLENPSGELRRRAIRVNLSCWIIPKADIPWTLVHRLTKGGADVNIVKFDASEGPKLAAMTIKALRKELKEALARAERSRAAAEAQYAEAGEGTKARDYFIRRADAIRARIDTLVDDFKTSAARFGIHPDTLDVMKAADAVAAIQNAMYNRARLYVEATARAAATNTATGTALAAQAAADAVPAGILADHIEDEGGDASTVRAAFSDDHTFSLAETEGD